MSRDIHSLCGTTNNSATTPAASKMKGAISQSASALGFASGRASRSVSRSDGKANANELTNFSQKRIVIAGRGDVRPWAQQQPVNRQAAEKADGERRHDPPAKPDRLRNGIGGKRGDEFGGFHSTDLRQAAPSDLSARWSATLTATSDIDRRFAVAAIDWPSREIEVTMSR